MKIQKLISGEGVEGGGPNNSGRGGEGCRIFFQKKEISGGACLVGSLEYEVTLFFKNQISPSNNSFTSTDCAHESCLSDVSGYGLLGQS